jgi:hypothetical protein
MNANHEVIKEALNKIKNEYLQNHQNSNWVALEEKIKVLSEISNSILDSDDELFDEIQRVSKIILTKDFN